LRRAKGFTGAASMWKSVETVTRCGNAARRFQAQEARTINSYKFNKPKKEMSTQVRAGLFVVVMSLVELWKES